MNELFCYFWIGCTINHNTMRQVNVYVEIFRVAFDVTSSAEHVSWEANSSASSEEIPRNWWKFSYRYHTNPPLFSVLWEMNPIHAMSFISEISILILSFYLKSISQVAYILQFSLWRFSWIIFSSLYSCIDNLTLQINNEAFMCLSLLFCKNNYWIYFCIGQIIMSSTVLAIVNIKSVWRQWE
jgi:hypothetical protein